MKIIYANEYDSFIVKLDLSYYEKVMESAVSNKKMEYIVLALRNGIEYPSTLMPMSGFIGLIEKSSLCDLEFLMSIPIIREHLVKWDCLGKLHLRVVSEGYDFVAKFLEESHGSIIKTNAKN